MRILSIVGTRPEAIKMAPIIKELARYHDQVESMVCTTGQHREMLDQMFAFFNIVPDFDLDIMRTGQIPTLVAARVLEQLDPILADLKPDWILVQGDTTTVMAASIAAHYRRVKVGHVEAGLRTYDRQNPFPEEMNRVVTDHVSDLHFAPTTRAKENLICEGIQEHSVFVTGNTVIDALLDVVEMPPPLEIETLLHDHSRNLILITIHRRENHGQPLEKICAAIRVLANRPDVHFIYAVHRNPNVWEPVHHLLGGLENVTLLPPVDYLPMVHLMQNSYLILTDSGGIQEEAPSLGVPVLVLRHKTERPEAVEAGAVRLVGNDTDNIVTEVSHLLEDTEAHQEMAQVINPYGDGQAAKRIVHLLLNNEALPVGIDKWQYP